MAYWSFVHLCGGDVSLLKLHCGGGVSFNDSPIHGSWRLGRDGEPAGIYATWNYKGDKGVALEHFYEPVDADVKVWSLKTRDGLAIPNVAHKSRCHLVPTETQPKHSKDWADFKAEHSEVFDDTGLDANLE